VGYQPTGISGWINEYCQLPGVFLQGRFGYAREQAAGPASTLVMFVGIFILVAAFPSGLVV
jgi:hypothetical protein